MDDVGTLAAVEPQKLGEQTRIAGDGAAAAIDGDRKVTEPRVADRGRLPGVAGDDRHQPASVLQRDGQRQAVRQEEPVGVDDDEGFPGHQRACLAYRSIVSRRATSIGRIVMPSAASRGLARMQFERAFTISPDDNSSVSEMSSTWCFGSTSSR